MKIKVKILDKELYDSIANPLKFTTQGSCAVDLYSAETFILRPNEYKRIKTGLSIWLGSVTKKEKKYAAHIIPRSGSGSQGLVLRNQHGLIDEDYQGEIMLSMYNQASMKDKQIFKIKRGDRIAQMYFSEVLAPTFQYVDDFKTTTKRGKKGFGSTGSK